MNVRLDRRSGEVSRGGRRIALTLTEFRILEQLMAAPDQVFSRSRLMKAAISGDVIVQARTIDVHVCSLRRKLGEPRLIVTIRKVGYRFAPDF